MKALEDQVCSLENGQKLAELGVKVNSYFKYEGVFYRSNANISTPDFYELHPPIGGRKSGYYYGYGISAYTVAELGQMLNIKGLAPEFGTTCCGGWWCCCKDYYGFERTEADARALMLIWLIENGHIDVEELNKGA